MVTFNFCSVMLIPMFMVIVYQMKRMATPSQVFAYCYLSAVVSGATLFAIADLFWLVAAFRPDRDPQLIMLLNDLAWITFTAPVGMIIAQNICLALAIYLDARPRPIFPRWVAPFSIVTALAMAPAACAAIVKTGPLAWNGLVSFWLRIGASGPSGGCRAPPSRRSHQPRQPMRPAGPVPGRCLVVRGRILVRWSCGIARKYWLMRKIRYLIEYLFLR